MLLYYFQDIVHFGIGAQRIPEVRALTEEYQDPALQSILRYVYFAYGRTKKNAYIGLPPVERRKSIIIEHDLFPEVRKKAGDEFYLDLESWPKVDAFLHRYLELHYSQLERQLLIIREKIEKYQRLLADPYAIAKDEREADEMLELFNKRAEQLENAILKEEEFGLNQPAAMHLFELPEDVKAFYAKIGFEF